MKKLGMMLLFGFAIGSALIGCGDTPDVEPAPVDIDISLPEGFDDEDPGTEDGSSSNTDSGSDKKN